MKWQISINILSEAIFSNGQSTPSEVDLDIYRDEFGFPYYGARALKGMWRTHTEHASLALAQGNRSGNTYAQMQEVIDVCFGRGGLHDAVQGKLKLTDAVVPKQVRMPFIHAIQHGQLYAEEVFHSMTEIRYFTEIEGDSGSVKDGSLRQFRVLRSGLDLVASVYGMEGLKPRDIGLLACGLASFQYAGTMKHRGKGQIRCSLLQNGRNVTSSYLDVAKEWVRVH